MMRSRKRPAWIIRWASSSGVGSTSPRHDPTSFIACFRTYRTSPHDWIGLYGFAAGTIIGDGCTKTYERRVTRYQRCAKPSLPAGDLPRGDLASDLRRVTPKALAEALSVLWLLTHDDLRCSIGATLDFGAKALASERPLLEGGRPNPSPPSARR